MVEVDDCETANGIRYCYCMKDLCNAPMGPPSVDYAMDQQHPPSPPSPPPHHASRHDDDEDLSSEGSGGGAVGVAGGTTRRHQHPTSSSQGVSSTTIIPPNAADIAKERAIGNSANQFQAQQFMLLAVLILRAVFGL